MRSKFSGLTAQLAQLQADLSVVNTKRETADQVPCSSFPGSFLAGVWSLVMAPLRPYMQAVQFIRAS